MKVVTVISDTGHPGYLQMLRSAKEHDIEVISLERPVRWGLQQQWIYEWAKTMTDPDMLFMYLDGYDTFFLSGAEEIKSKLPKCDMYLHPEKVCFPDPSIESRYPLHASPWRFVNGGGYITTVGFYRDLYEKQHTENINDQTWLSEMFLQKKGAIEIDHMCSIFQPLAPWVDGVVAPVGDIKRVFNTVTQSMPVVIHGNGGVNMDWIYRNMI